MAHKVAAASFSIHYGKGKTLDLVAQNLADYELWTRGNDKKNDDDNDDDDDDDDDDEDS